MPNPHTTATQPTSPRPAPGGGVAWSVAGSVATLAGPWPGLFGAFSTAMGRAPDPALAEAVRAQVGRVTGFATANLPRPLMLRQTHSTALLELSSRDEATAANAPACDGALAAGRTARLLAIKSADCVPLLASEPHTGRYAALHAGWRGAAEGILQRLLERWIATGADPGRVRLELGPHIHGCCYEVRADCLERFAPESLDGAVREAGGRTYLELAAVLAEQAFRAGVPRHRVHVSAICTYCHRAADGSAPYASYRRATHRGEAFARTNVALIGWLPGG